MKVIYAIPGLGTTRSLFRKISIPGHELKVLDWPVPQKNITLKDYATEFLKQIDSSEPVNLIGVSFGGMLCSELADTIPVKKVVLISSCKTSLEFPTMLRIARKSRAHLLMPDKWLKRISKNSRLIIGFEKSLQQEFSDMADSMQDNYFSYCVNYIVNWNKTKSNPAIVSIHGTADRLLTYPQVKSDYTIKNGTHAMIYNNSDEINGILNKEFNGS